MSSEIMLGVNFDENKVTYPVEVSVKLDGVAADFYKTPTGWVAQSRQGKPLPSTGKIIRYLNSSHDGVDVNTHIIGELTVMGVDVFKDAAGIIRRGVADNRIVLNVYDVYVAGKETEPYETRVRRIRDFIDNLTSLSTVQDGTLVWQRIRRVPVTGVAGSKAELFEYFETMTDLLASSKLFEGMMVRCLRGVDSHYKVGGRSRNMMKYKPQPTVDLEVISFEEATANKVMSFLGEEMQPGQGLRAVGRIVAMFNGEPIGVGPGSLTHRERRDLWMRYSKHGCPDLTGKGLIAEVQYMTDSSYTALREARFKRWRTDKQYSNEEV